jgi:hypothetical protein
VNGPPGQERRTGPGGGPFSVEVTTNDQATIADACSLADHLDKESAYAAGYADGFTSGHDVGAARVVDGIRHVLGDVPDLLGSPELARLGEGFRGRYAASRAGMLADPVDLCPVGQARLRQPESERTPHRCATCNRVAAREENWHRWGCGDFPPAEVRAAVMLRQLARTS